MWAGRKIVPGFKVNMQKTLPDGRHNPEWRKYSRFDLYADVVLAYFELFRKNEGNLKAIWNHIEAYGPFFPEITRDQIPEGFKVTDHLKRRSTKTGQLCPSISGLQHMLINVAYIGHWIHKGVIVQRHNHESIIPNDLFMYAFNRIPSVDFYGESNPNYVPYRPWTRHKKADRNQPSPTYANLIYSDDIQDHPHHRVAAIWSQGNGNYKYQLYHTYCANVWNINAAIVDKIIDRMLLERLKATTIDEGTWQNALTTMEDGNCAEVRRLEVTVKQSEIAKDNLIASLTTLSHPEMVERAEARYQALELEIEPHQAELCRLKSGESKRINLEDAKPVLETVIGHWVDVQRQERRELFESFATYINISKLTRYTKTVTVHWRDGSTSTESTTHRSKGYFWEDEDLAKLKSMIDNDIDQIDILRTFPDYRWRALTQRMRYHFGKGWWKSYTGEKKYNRDTTWADTEEAHMDRAQQLKSSEGCTDQSLFLHKVMAQ